MLPPQAKSDLIGRLREEIAACERWDDSDRVVLATGIPALDGMLPRRGLYPGSLVELLDERAGSGAETLAVIFARATERSHGVIVVMDRERQFYPLAAAAWGLSLDRLVIVRPTSEAEELWAADQALRSRAVAAVWLRRDRLKPHDFRRLHLAAEEGGTLGVLLRPVRVRGLPTWADVQMVVEPRLAAQGRALRVQITRCRGGTAGRMADVELDDESGSGCGVGRHETLPVPAIAALADPTSLGRTPRPALRPAHSASA